MFSGTQEQLSQPTNQAPTTAEEEAAKRNTDCVYFLASPLTCKKGSECEYRHSDIARVNPRDCWYWLNGNCLNPKCGFRHPPLDGLLGTHVPTPLGPTLPPSQTVAAPSALAPYVLGKQAVPCIYFQKGNCLKGDICPFMHASYPVSNKVAQFAAATSVTESQSNKKTFGGLEKCSQEQKVSQIDVPKSAELPLQAKEVTRMQMYPLRNAVAIRKNMPLATSLKDEFNRYMSAKVYFASNGNSVSRSNRNQQVHVPDDPSILNGKDAEEFSREHSPGFDVLVDDELRDSDYFPGEDQFGKTTGHEERNSNPGNDYEIGRSDYNSMTDVDRNMYRESHGYESNEHLQGHYGWEENRATSERMLGGLALERRRYPRADSADQIDESDLRHHLSKQKRGNGLRSVISLNHARKNDVEDQRHRVSRRDHLPAQESSVSSRLRGRINIPGRLTSAANKNDSWSERDIERGRHRGRLSPERPQGRLRDRIKGRVHEDFNNEERNFSGSHIRRDIDDNNAEFTGPKRLAELKVGKKYESYDQHIGDRLSLGKRKYPKLEGAPQQIEGNISFEGPKPLSEILKRKRGEGAVYESGMTSVNNEDNDQKKGKESFMMPIETKETKGVFSCMSSDELNRVHGNKEDSKPAAGDIGETEEKIKSTQIEEDIIGGDEAMEDQGAEGYDHREGEYDYDQADGEDYNLDEGENVDPTEEYEYYEDDDDADDFAKKMGVLYS